MLIRSSCWQHIFIAFALASHSMVATEVDADLKDALATLKTAESGESPTGLSDAWREVGEASIGDLDKILVAFESATPAGANYLSSAIDAVLQKRRRPVANQRIRRCLTLC